MPGMEPAVQLGIHKEVKGGQKFFSRVLDTLIKTSRLEQRPDFKCRIFTKASLRGFFGFFLSWAFGTLQIRKTLWSFAAFIKCTRGEIDFFFKVLIGCLHCRFESQNADGTTISALLCFFSQSRPLIPIGM